MTAWVFLFATAAFGVAFGIHVLWWRSARPKDDLKWLFLCMLGIPTVLLLAALFLFSAASTLELLMGWFLSCCIGAAYFFWYPAAQAASPTMLITLIAHSGGQQGVTREDLIAAMPTSKLVREGIDNLFKERFAEEKPDGTVVLLPRGERTLRTIRAMRSLAGFTTQPRG